MSSEHDNRLFVVDKAVGPTSFDVVSALRRAARVKKVGHTGTLDPLAHGVLLLCTGVATRAVEHFMNLEKEYAFTVRLGVETTTLDTEGEVVREGDVPDMTLADAREAAMAFVGTYSLTPPAYSAVKRDGKRSYELARNGEASEPPARDVSIYSFEVTGLELPDVHCVVRCSRGTYVRSLARDLGQKLGTPAHVTSLARTRIGPFGLDGAFPSGRIFDKDIDEMPGHSLDDALSFLPGLVLSVRARKALAYGSLPDAQDVTKTMGTLAEGAVRLLDEQGHLVAVGQRNPESTRDRLHMVDSFRLFVDPESIRGGSSA